MQNLQFLSKIHPKKLLAAHISCLKIMLSKCIISNFLEAIKYSLPMFLFTNMQIFFCCGGKVLKPLKSVLVKIGYKKSSNEAKEIWFLLKCWELNNKYLKKVDIFISNRTFFMTDFL